MNERTVKDLNLTRYEKAMLVMAMCLIETDAQPTMSNIVALPIETAKDLLSMPSIIGSLFLINRDRKTVLSLMDKVGVK